VRSTYRRYSSPNRSNRFSSSVWVRITRTHPLPYHTVRNRRENRARKYRKLTVSGSFRRRPPVPDPARRGHRPNGVLTRSGSGLQDMVWLVLMIAVGAAGLILIVWLVQLVRYLTRRKNGRTDREQLSTQS
jgi:hypothetical protein